MKKRLLLTVLLLALFLTHAKVQALYDCCGSGDATGLPGDCAGGDYCRAHVQLCCYPDDCKEDNTVVANSNCGAANNTCCRSGSCASECGAISMWDWCRAMSCLATADPNAAECVYDYSYQYSTCQATDTCYPGASDYLYAALCDDTAGCAIGGQYKTCCNADGTVAACIGGEHSGGCPQPSAILPGG